MKKQLLLAILFIASLGANSVLAQNKDLEKKKKDPNYFDETSAYEIAKAKGVQPIDQKAYVEHLRNVFNSKQNQKPHNHSHNNPVKSVTINLTPNNSQSIGCGNMGFENYDFTNWSGTTGTITQNNPVVTYNATATNIVNPSGNNVFMNNTNNYHTILTIPPTNPIYPNCNPGGYDSIAVKNVGGQLISEIPFVSPFSFDGASARIGGTSPGEAGELKYTVTKSSTVQQISFSYALVLQNGGISHSLQTGPIFSVKVINQATGAILPGCTSYTFNPYSNNPADSLKQSAIASDVYYRKWNNYSVDLSSLPNGTNVTVVFLVTGCTLGGHFGYAYVDAQCGSIGTPYANMCSGSNFATLVAPPGYTSYQWIGPSGTIAGATNDTLIENPATPGTTYTVNMASQGGCIVTQTVTIGLTSVNIININTTNSCPNGASGTAFVQANGSNGVYTYSWTNTTPGPNFGMSAGTTQTVSGLPPGTYSVLVSSTSCGQASANLSVGTAPPFYFNQTKPFCGNSTFIAQPNGSNYTWYSGSSLIPAPNGANDTLYINNAIAGDAYTVVYNNQQGCRDSIRYTLTQVAGGSSYFSNITNVCPNDSNGTAVLNLNTPFPAPYSYVVTGPTSADNVLTTSTTATAVTISSLAPGTYTAVISDGTCIYNNTVTIGVISTNFTMTPTNTVLCFPEEVVVKLDFGETAPSSCGLSSSSSCTSPNIIQVGNATTSGSSNNYSPYGGLWESQKNQFLFRASELLAAGITPGKINSLALNVTNTNGNATTFNNFTIKLKCVSYNVLSTATMDNTGLIQVFNPTTINATTGWNTYNFTQSYDWDGTSNILVDICFFNPNWDGNLSVEYSNPGFIASKYVNDDGVNQCPLNTVVGSGNERPNIKFGNCGASNPASYTVSVSSNGTITANYSNDSIRIAPTFTTPPGAPGTVVYTISVTNPVGNCVTSQTLAILYPPLTTTVVVTPTTFTLCQGNNTTFTASGAANYNWYYNSGGTLVPISTASVINVTPPAAGTNTYVVTGTPICPSGTSDTKTVTVNVTPLANILITPLADVTKCLNKDFIFHPVTASVPTNTAATYAYSWTTLPGGAPAPGVNTSSSYTTSSNVTTTLVVSVSAPCSNPTSDTVVVKNLADDLGITISNSITTCPNTAFTLTSTTSGGNAPYFYTWTLGTNTLATTPDVSGTSPGTGGAYTISVTVMDSCSYVHSNTQIINVLPNTLNVSILDSSSTCGGTPFTLNAQAFNGYPNYTYVWTMGGSQLSNSQGLSSTSPTAEGNYSVFVTATDSCGYQATDIQLINVLPPCMVEIPNVITPNGDTHNDFFKIKNIEYHPNTKVTIFDRWGRKVFESNNYNNEWKGDGVSDGTFFYVIEVPEDKKYSGYITIFRN
ncbi:MAG TPA: gliding motility-associated C-terminal domain-containing protein [Bacteroidia bacterium]|nr:gliding motility-associated C-terminal domain-containing protein [Bacteroidia bacterium]